MQSLGKISQKKSHHLFQQRNHANPALTINPLCAPPPPPPSKPTSPSIPLDVRGLQAFPPGGEAQNASLHGQSAYNGNAVFNDLNGNADSQETLSTLADDTGGKAFFDSNDFSGVFSQVQKDTSAYYVLGFTSTNRLKGRPFPPSESAAQSPGRETRISLGLLRRSRLPAPESHRPRTATDDELDAPISRKPTSPSTPARPTSARMTRTTISASRSSFPARRFPSCKPKTKTTPRSTSSARFLPVLGNARRSSARHREARRRQRQQVRRKNVQYNTGFLLAPGSYHLKFVVRENQHRTHGLVRNRRAHSRSAQSPAAHELCSAQQPARSRHAKEKSRSTR